MRELVAFGPHDGAHHVALRAGISVGIPLLSLLSVDRLEWALYAAFGAFPAIYGRSLAGRARLRMQSSAAATFVASVALGTIVGIAQWSPWTSVVIIALWAALIALVSERFTWTPPGSLFQVFALGACASVGDTARLGPALLVSTSAAVLALIIGLIPGGLTRTPARRRSLNMLLRQTGVQKNLMRYVLAAGAAGTIATAAGLGHAYWAALSAIVPLAAADTAGRVLRAAHRMLGTFVGLGVAAIIFALRLDGLLVVLVIVLLQVAAELFVVRNYGLAMVFITPLALTMVELTQNVDARALITDRAVTTFIGIVAGIAAILVLRKVPPTRRPPQS